LLLENINIDLQVVNIDAIDISDFDEELGTVSPENTLDFSILDPVP